MSSRASRITKLRSGHSRCRWQPGPDPGDPGADHAHVHVLHRHPTSIIDPPSGVRTRPDGSDRPRSFVSRRRRRLWSSRDVNGTAVIAEVGPVAAGSDQSSSGGDQNDVECLLRLIRSPPDADSRDPVVAGSLPTRASPMDRARDESDGARRFGRSCRAADDGSGRRRRDTNWRPCLRPPASHRSCRAADDVRGRRGRDADRGVVESAPCWPS